MKSLGFLASALVLVTPILPDTAEAQSRGAADVAVAPFVVEHDSGGVLRAVADSCLERLVKSGDEMRSYFNSDENPQAIADLGAAASGRIAAFVQERKGSPPAR